MLLLCCTVCVNELSGTHKTNSAELRTAGHDIGNKDARRPGVAELASRWRFPQTGGGTRYTVHSTQYRATHVHVHFERDSPRARNDGDYPMQGTHTLGSHDNEAGFKP